MEEEQPDWVGGLLVLIHCIVPFVPEMALGRQTAPPLSGRLSVQSYLLYRDKCLVKAGSPVQEGEVPTVAILIVSRGEAGVKDLQPAVCQLRGDRRECQR